MLLNEWKSKTLESFKNELYEEFEQGNEVTTHEALSEAAVAELKEQFLVESWGEIVEDFDEIELIDEDDLTKFESDLQETIEFVPLMHAEEMDIEAEFDLNIHEMNMMMMDKVKDLFFAESYEIEIDENANRAKVVFKRAKGEITKKKKCGPGMMLKGFRCIPQGGSMKSKERVKGIKLKRAKRAMGAGKKKKAAIKAKITKKRVNGRARNFSNLEN